MDDIINSKIEGDNECKFYHGQEIKFTYSRSLWARLIQATDITKKNYKEIREYIASFDKVKIRESWNYISVVQSKRTLIKMNLTKNDVLVYFALTPAQITKINYDYEDVSNVKAFESTPVKFRINENPDSIKKAIKLVNVVMSRFKISRTDKLVECNIPEYESHEDLIKDGKIKVYVKNLDTNTIYSDSESLNIYYDVKQEEEKAQQEILKQQEEERIKQEQLESNSEFTQEQNVQDDDNNTIDNTTNEENVVDNNNYSNDLEEDEDSLKFQDNYNNDNETFDDEEEDEEQYLNVTETETEPVVESKTSNEEPSTETNVENEADSNRLEIEEKVQELLSEKTTTADGLPSNAYKYINSIISVNFEQVIKEIQSLREEIQNIKITNTTIIQPTQTQYVPKENISNNEVVNETVDTSYEQPKTDEDVNQTQTVIEQPIVNDEPVTEPVSETTTVKDENNQQIDNISTNTYQENYSTDSDNNDNNIENIDSNTENVETTETTKNDEVSKEPKKKNIIARMNDYELPKSAFYITFGTLAFVFIVTCIIINLIV